jgi:hypothetical protein
MLWQGFQLKVRLQEAWHHQHLVQQLLLHHLFAEQQ